MDGWKRVRRNMTHGVPMHRIFQAFPLTLALSAPIVAGAAAQTSTTPKNKEGPTIDKPLPAGKQRQIDALLEQFRRAQRIPGLSAAITVNGYIVYGKGFGQARPGVKATRNTVYPIGQVTQQFTAGAIMLLRQRGLGMGGGKLAMSDKLTAYFKGVTHWRDASVGNLLTHTSGVPALKDSIFYEERIFSQAHRITQRRVLEFIKARDVLFTPGTQWKYSDSNYFLLANVIEIGLELFYHDYITSEFFELFLMPRSSFLARQPLNQRAYGTIKGKPAPEINPNMLFGSADATSTAMDLQAWSNAVMRTKLFDPKSRSLLFGQYIALPGMIAPYGAGFYVRKGGAWNEYFTIGEIPGFTAINKILHRPGKDTWGKASGQDIYVAILTNADKVKGLDRLATQIALIAYR